ncbi:MAG: MFS transporter, partial [Clostridia bacterium]|nr:MFS transporter [Clostridia bacterium]
DRYNPERLITVGLLGGAIANGIIFFNHNFYVMLIAWALNAASQFALWPGVFKIISSQLVRSDRSQMIFLISFSSPTGLLLGYVIAAFIPSWNWNFAISSIILFLLAAGLYIASRALSPDMKPDMLEKPDPVPDTTVPEGTPATSTMRLFAMSGLLLVFMIALFRMVIAQGIQTLSPTLLMESYTSVTPRIGNLLQAFILASGMLGTLLARTVLYPKYIRHEVRGQLWFYSICLPLSVLLLFVGRISLWLAIPSLCIILIALSACALLIQYYNIYFIPYGKNGTVAGIINAGASFGVVIANYGSLALADNFGWSAVILAWVVMILLTIGCVLLALRPTTRFREQVRRIWRA